ncbi:MAG: hypothetical protein P8Z30_01385 [Acidobacteriota bacterium]
MRMVVAAGCLALLWSPSAYAIPAQKKGKEEKLIEKIQREKNPGKKARLQIKLAKLKLSQAGTAYDQKDFARGKALLQQYLEHIKTSWATLQSANGAVKKHLEAFKKLEIALGEDERLLEDMRHRIPYPENEFVGKVKEESSAVHAQVLEALFPSGFSRKQRTRGSKRPKNPAAAKAGAAKS